MEFHYDNTNSSAPYGICWTMTIGDVDYPIATRFTGKNGLLFAETQKASARALRTYDWEASRWPLGACLSRLMANDTNWHKTPLFTKQIGDAWYRTKSVGFDVDRYLFVFSCLGRYSQADPDSSLWFGIVKGAVVVYDRDATFIDQKFDDIFSLGNKIQQRNPVITHSDWLVTPLVGKAGLDYATSSIIWQECPDTYSYWTSLSPSASSREIDVFAKGHKPCDGFLDQVTKHLRFFCTKYISLSPFLANLKDYKAFRDVVERFQGIIKDVMLPTNQSL